MPDGVDVEFGCQIIDPTTENGRNWMIYASPSIVGREIVDGNGDNCDNRRISEDVGSCEFDDGDDCG